MIDETFRNKQNQLFFRYYWSKYISRPVAGIAIFLASATGAADTNSGSYGPVLMWSGILLLFITELYRSSLKKKLQSRLWAEYANILHSQSAAAPKTYHGVLAGPVVQANAYSLIPLRTISGSYKNYPTTLQDLTLTYQQSIAGNDTATCKLRYVIQAVELPASLPHLFIASKQNAKKKLNQDNNLWSLTTKLNPEQKLQNLEGDFGKYFEVYTAHSETDGIVFENEVDALRVLTPDVMLALRDSGFNFDYEIYKNFLYVIHEPDLLTAAQLENFVKSLDAALSEIIPQLIGHNFADDGTKLTIKKAALTLDILLGQFVQPAKLTLIFLVLIILGAIVGSSLQ